MEMIILNNEGVEELEKINSINLHLNRAVKAVKLNDDEHGVNSDLMNDKTTWEKWIGFLEDKPRKEIDLSELQD
tara:strand:+ start:279 stop:500 length:222 start_codon:yes stop_codon:yes gene_type:complete